MAVLSLTLPCSKEIQELISLLESQHKKLSPSENSYDLWRFLSKLFQFHFIRLNDKLVWWTKMIKIKNWKVSKLSVFVVFHHWVFTFFFFVSKYAFWSVTARMARFAFCSDFFSLLSDSSLVSFLKNSLTPTISFTKLIVYSFKVLHSKDTNSFLETFPIVSINFVWSC